MATHPKIVASRLKTRQMGLLLALDEQRNLHQAAGENSMSQPAASKMLKDIEELFGVPLFERLPRGVVPTRYGQTLIRHVRIAVAQLTEAQASIAAMSAGLAGQVEIGVIVTPSLTLVPRAVAATKAQAPSLSIGVEVDTSNVLIDRLRRGRLDFVLARILQNEDESGLLYEELSEETECIVVRNGHPWLSREGLALSDMGEACWILSSRGTILRHRVDLMFLRAGLPTPTNVVETTAMSVIKGLLQQTDFVHVMPVDVARYYVASQELAVLPIDVPCRMEGFGIVLRQNRLLTPGAELLLGHVRNVARQIYPSRTPGLPTPSDPAMPGDASER